MKKEPIKHHYIPQFILRNFSDEKGCVYYFDKVINETRYCNPRDIFMERNLYRDEVNYVENPTKIEMDLSKFEKEISDIIKDKLLVGEKVALTREEEERIKIFFFIMGFRSYNTMLWFLENISYESAEMYSLFQKNKNFLDLWKRNLGYLVNCRSIEDILNHKYIDEPMKVWATRDVFGCFGLHLSIVEKREGAGFVVGDAYPTVVTGTLGGGINVPIYSINPISSNRVILVIWNGAEEVPREVLGFRQTILYKPLQYEEEDKIVLRVKKLYPEEVDVINRLIANAAQRGYVFGEETADL